MGFWVPYYQVIFTRRLSLNLGRKFYIDIATKFGTIFTFQFARPISNIVLLGIINSDSTFIIVVPSSPFLVIKKMFTILSNIQTIFQIAVSSIMVEFAIWNLFC